MGTLDASLPESQKAFRTEQLANQWERHSPIPVQDREVPRVDETHNSGKSATEKPRMPGYIAVSGVVTYIRMCVCVYTHVNSTGMPAGSAFIRSYTFSYARLCILLPGSFLHENDSQYRGALPTVSSGIAV